jgi:hypothetical protein
MSKTWFSVAVNSTSELQKQGYDLAFTQAKNDDSYVKAKASVPCAYWAFAKTSSNLWVELELKPRTVKDKRIPQDGIYDKIIADKNKIEEMLGGEIVCSLGGNDRRIKSYLSHVSGQVKPYEGQCVARMVAFVKTLNGYLTR